MMKNRQAFGMNQGCWRAAISLFFVFCTGCSVLRFRDTYHDENMDFGAIKTVAVLPFENLSSDRSAATRVRDVFVTKLLATYGVYVLPTGEVMDGIGKTEIANPMNPTPEEAVKLAAKVKAEAIISGTLREYGEVRSSQTTANVISLSLRMMEAQTGKVVWTASSTKGGVGILDRLFGSGGGKPMNDTTVKAVDDLINQLF